MFRNDDGPLILVVLAVFLLIVFSIFLAVKNDSRNNDLTDACLAAEAKELYSLAKNALRELGEEDEKKSDE